MAVIAQASKGSATLDEQNLEQVQNLMQIEEEVTKLHSEVSKGGLRGSTTGNEYSFFCVYAEIQICSGVQQSQQGQRCKHLGRQCSCQAN